MNASTITIALSGPATLVSAPTIQSRLSQALEGGLPVEIDCSAVTEVDLTFVQLLLAARRTAEMRRQRLTLRTRNGDPLHAVLIRAGLIEFQGRSAVREEDPFWTGGEA